MTTHRPHKTKNVTGALDLVIQHHRREKFRKRRPARVSPFVAVKRPFAGSAFSPPLGPIRIGNTREDDAPFSSATETGFEKVNERQANFAQFNRLD
jgi:hypothetical protein